MFSCSPGGGGKCKAGGRPRRWEDVSPADPDPGAAPGTFAVPPPTARRAWEHAAVAAVVVVLMGTVLSGAVRAVAEIVVLALGLAAIACALGRHRTTSVIAWRGLAATMVLFALSTAAEIPMRLGIARDAFAPVESGLDIAAYAALVVAALGQLAAGQRRRDREAWADTSSLLLAAG